MQIQLMILLGIPPLSRRQNLRRDLLPLPPLLLGFLCNLLCLRFLLGTVRENRTAVLRAGIHALTVQSGGIVHLVEEFEERVVGEGRRVEGHLEGFRV